MKEKLYFYYTNDFHSNFGQWPRVVGFLKEAKAEKTRANQSCWLVDVGDHMDRVHPIAEAFMGKANIQLMNDAGYDLATLGNNEGITLAHDNLYHLYDEADFQVLCANLQNMQENEPEWLQLTSSIQSAGGVRVGVIGLTVPFNDFYHLLGWHVENPYQTLQRHINHLKQSSDVIVLISHLGLNEDQEIARRFDDIDVIIGGHTHHLLRTGEEVNNAVITAAGKQSSFVGEVILTWDHALERLVGKEAYTTDVTHAPKDLITEQSLDRLNESSSNILGKPVIHIKHPIEVKWFQDTELMQSLTDTLREWTRTDCAMLNAGLLLDRIEAGKVTYQDIHRICPHPINPCVVELNGDELLEVIRASFTREFMELKLKGFGFRGEVLGRMVYSGLDIETAVHEDGQEYVKNAIFHGETLDPERIYTVAAPDTFTFGRLLPEIAKSSTKQFYLPEFIRDLLAETLQSKFSGK